jgi:hypothetical protein
MSLLFTGQVTIPNVAGATEKTSQNLRDYNILKQRKEQAEQAAQLRREQLAATNKLRAEQLAYNRQKAEEDRQFRAEQAEISNEFRRQQLALQADSINARTRAAEAKQLKDAQNARDAKVGKVYGESLASSHQSSTPFLRQALEITAERVGELMMLPNGAVEADKLMRNTFDSIARYNDDDAWHAKETEITALIDPNSAEYKNVAKGMKYYRPHVSLDEVTAMSKAARGENVQDMELKYNDDGSFTIMGTDAGGDAPSDISTHQWFNNPNIFKYTTLPVAVRDSETIGRTLGDEHKKAFESPDKVYDDVYSGAVSRGTSPMDFTGVAHTDPRYETRVNAFNADKEDIKQKFGIQSDEEIFTLYEFNPNNPLLQGEGNALRMRLERSIQDEAKREAEAARYNIDTDEDKEQLKIEESRDKAYTSGIAGERRIPSLIADGGAEDESIKTATFNLKNLETKAFENSPVTIPNPQYAAFVEQMGGEQQAIALATMPGSGLRLPPKNLKYDVEDITFAEGQPDLVEIGLSGTDERLLLNLNDMDDDSVKLRAFMEAAFAKVGLDFDGFRNAAQKMWEGRPTGQPTESVAPTLTGSSR